MKGVELGHHGDHCSFDAFVEKYRIADPAIHEIQLIVRDADANGGRSLALGAALRVVAEGYAMMCRNDHEVLEKEFIFYDALYAYFKAKSGQNQA